MEKETILTITLGALGATLVGTTALVCYLLFKSSTINEAWVKTSLELADARFNIDQHKALELDMKREVDSRRGELNKLRHRVRNGYKRSYNQCDSDESTSRPLYNISLNTTPAQSDTNSSTLKLTTVKQIEVRENFIAHEYIIG